MTALRTDPGATTGVPTGALRLAGSQDAGCSTQGSVSLAHRALEHRWVPLPVAARLMQQSEGNLRRRCPRWQEQGLAIVVRPEGSRNALWHICPSVDPSRLGRAHLLPEVADAPHVRSAPGVETLLTAPESKRREAETKAAIVTAFRLRRDRPGFKVKRDFPAFAEEMRVKHGLDAAPSRTRVYAWCEASPSDGEYSAVASSLLDQRGGDRSGSISGGGGGGSTSPEAWTLFETLYLNPNRLSVRKCWAVVDAEASRHGWRWPSLSRVKALARERITPARLCLMREGESAWAEGFKAPLAQAPDKWAPGDCWESDHSQLDFFIRVRAPGGATGGAGEWKAARPWLTAWLDRGSRALVGWKVSMEHNAETIQAALLHALKHGPAREWGPPRLAWMDNGRDFDSAAMTGETKKQRRARLGPATASAGRGGAHDGLARTPSGPGALAGCEPGIRDGLLRHLRIEPHFANPFNHNGKGRIERFFGWVHQDFDRQQLAWCGSDRDRRDPDSLALVLAPERVMALPTLEDARERFAAWAESSNARNDHAIDDLRDGEGPDAQRLSPLEFYCRFAPARRVVSEDALSLLEQRWERPVKVGKQGVGLRIGGRTHHYGATEPRLEALKGGSRFVRVSFDPDDITQVRVYDEGYAFLCVARMNDHFGQRVSREAMVTAVSARREQKRLASRRPDVSLLLGTDADAALAAQREMDVAEGRRRVAGVIEERAMSGDAPRLVLSATPLDGQARAVEIAEARQLCAAPGAPDDDADTDEIDLADADPRERAPDDDDDELLLAVGEQDADDFDVLGALT